jgi:hypothetical protein
MRWGISCACLPEMQKTPIKSLLPRVLHEFQRSGGGRAGNTPTIVFECQPSCTISDPALAKKLCTAGPERAANERQMAQNAQIGGQVIRGTGAECDAAGGR